MIFRRKSSKAVAQRTPETTEYAVIYVHEGENRKTFGNQIVEIIEKSSFCTSSPLVKRLIVKNVKVWCVVIETSGTKSVKVICASVPYMLNLIARISPRFKALMEDERVVSQLKFFQEIDFESLLSSLCSATVVIHSGVKKCYQIISVHLGHEAYVFTKNSLCFMKNLFVKGVISAFHFLCEDMPHILQSLCSQNYAFAKYLVENSPMIALGGAKHFLQFTLLMQRLAVAGLKGAKRIAKFAQRALLNVFSEIDFSELLKTTYGYFISAIVFVTSQSTYKALKSAVVRFLQWCYPILQKSVPLVWSRISDCVEKIIPMFERFIRRLWSSLPKILNFCDENKANAMRLIYLAQQYLRDMLFEIKPFCAKLFKTLEVSSTYINQLLRFFAHYVKLAASEMYRNLRRLLSSEETKKAFRKAFLLAKEMQPIAYGLFRKGCKTLMEICKHILKTTKDFLSSSSTREKARQSYELAHEISSFMQPIVVEINLTCYICAGEVIAKSHSIAQKVSPTLWRGVKIAAPVTVQASREILSTVKSSAVVVYPELLKAGIFVFPDLRKGFAVVLQDSSSACAEIATTSYFASQELLFAAKCISLQLPTVYKALNAVSVTSSGAVTEIIHSSSRAKIRVKNDLGHAFKEVSSALSSAEVEIMDTVSDMAAVFPEKEVNEMIVLISETNKFILTRTFKTSIHSVSAVSYHVVQCGTDVIRRILQMITKPTDSQKIASSKNYFEEIKLLLVNVLLFTSDYALECFKQFSVAVFHKMCAVVPTVWTKYKTANGILWSRLCESSSQFWSLLELHAGPAFQFTCFYTPDLWNFLKRNSFRVWRFTCDKSPNVYDVLLPVFPVLYASNCSAVRYVWELQVNTCSSTWKVIMPVTSSSWKYLVECCPQTWVKFCANSKSQWNVFCDVVEFSWNVMTATSSLSWKLLHKSVSKSWKSVLRPVTTSTCGTATSAVVKSYKLSNSVCSKSKEILLSYKTFEDFSDVSLGL